MEIFTPRLRLREFVAGDWPAVLAYQRDPRYLRFQEWEDRTPEAVQAFVQMFVDHQRAHPRSKFQLAITLREGGALIGNCGVRLNEPGGYDAETGYELAPKHWGRGYATEAARAMLDFGFGTLGLHRIMAYCVAENSASAHVLEKLGMKLEGRLRECWRIKGQWHDNLMYAVLEHEWRLESPFARSA